MSTPLRLGVTCYHQMVPFEIVGADFVSIAVTDALRRTVGAL